MARQLQDPREHRFARQRQYRPLSVPRNDDGHQQRLDRQVVGHHQRSERALHVGSRPDSRRHHVGEGDHLQHRSGPRPVQQPALVHGRLLPPQHHRPLHRRSQPPAGAGQRGALRQLRQPEDQGLGGQPRLARFVQAGRQALQLQPPGHALGQPQLDYGLLQRDRRPDHLLQGHGDRRDLGLPHRGHLRQQRRGAQRPGLQLLQERRDVPRLRR